jgi:hypothetical protein
MPGCVLRAAGRDFAVDVFLATSPLCPCAVWRRGERRTPRRPPSKDAGFNLLVSDAPGGDLPSQARDAVRILTEHHEELARLMAWEGVEGAVLDFGVERRGVVVQCEAFPAPLIRLAGGLGLAIELSLYPEMGGTGEV